MSKISFQHTTLISLIRQWADARNIIKGASSKDQMLKMQSEFGELGGAIVEGVVAHNKESAAAAQDKITDGIGDTIVVLTIVAAQEGFDLEDAVGQWPDMTKVPAYEYFLASEYIGLLTDAVLKRDVPAMPRLAAAIYCQLEDLATHLGFNFVECIAYAYNEIKDRKGVMYNGAYIKSTDPMYAQACADLGKAE